jgi:phenylacetaldehyde dehydrogenase
MSTAQKEVIIDQHVRAYLDVPRKMVINGKWVDSASGKTFQSFNPATGGVLAEVAEGDREDINRAVSAARAARRLNAFCRQLSSTSSPESGD